MTERITTVSYVVRVYRVDAENSRSITGVVEMLDGSGKRKAFSDLDELAAVLAHKPEHSSCCRRAAAKPK